MQKPHSFFLSPPRPHARQTNQVRDRGTVKSADTIYLPKLSDYTYFHDKIFFFFFFFFLEVAPSRGRSVQGRVRTGKSFLPRLWGGKKNPHGIELRSNFVFVSFLFSSSFSMLSRKDGGVWREFSSLSSVSGTYREECCSSSLPWPVVSAASASPLSRPTSWEPRWAHRNTTRHALAKRTSFISTVWTLLFPLFPITVVSAFCFEPEQRGSCIVFRTQLLWHKDSNSGCIVLLHFTAFLVFASINSANEELDEPPDAACASLMNTG